MRTFAPARECSASRPDCGASRWPPRIRPRPRRSKRGAPPAERWRGVAERPRPRTPVRQGAVAHALDRGTGDAVPLTFLSTAKTSRTLATGWRCRWWRRLRGGSAVAWCTGLRSVTSVIGTEEIPTAGDSAFCASVEDRVSLALRAVGAVGQSAPALFSCRFLLGRRNGEFSSDFLGLPAYWPRVCLSPSWRAVRAAGATDGSAARAAHVVEYLSDALSMTPASCGEASPGVTHRVPLQPRCMAAITGEPPPVIHRRRLIPRWVHTPSSEWG